MSKFLRVLATATVLMLAQAERASAADPTPAEGAPAGTTVVVSDATAASLLMQAGRFDEAKLVLTNYLQTNPGDSQAEFLLGMIAMEQMDFAEAVAQFRSILVREPDAERVRLELARAFFLQRDYENAARQFRFARAGNLPDEAKLNVDQFLGAIARLREWSYDFSFALEEDTNVNAATDLRQIDIFGLPFTLSDDARKTSGRGVSLDAGGEWSPLLAESTKGRLGLRVRRAEYGGGDFDDMTLSGYVGPEFLAPRWQVVVLATGFQRWFGNSPFNDGLGARLGANYAVVGNLQLGLSFDWQSISFETDTAQNSGIATIGANLSYTLSPSSTVRFFSGFGARNARDDGFSSTTWWSGIGYYRDLPFGFSLYVEPSISTARYHAAFFGFGATRKDDTWSVRAEALNRRIDIQGFTPKLTILYADQSSSIALYRYKRTQFTIAATRQF